MDMDETDDLGTWAVLLQKALDQTLDHLAEINGFTEKTKGILTGFSIVDEHLSGFHKGELVVIAGRPQSGHEPLAYSIVEHVILNSKKSVGIFSLAILSYLLANDSVLRKEFFELIVKSCNAEKYFPKNFKPEEFELEHGFIDGLGGHGRIDIWLKSDKFVLAIENKLYASFQDDQLKRYLDYLGSRPEGGTYTCLVLSPISKKGAVYEHCGELATGKEKIMHLFWEDLLGHLGDYKYRYRPDIRYLIEQLDSYYHSRVTDIHTIKNGIKLLFNSPLPKRRHDDRNIFKKIVETLNCYLPRSEGAEMRLENGSEHYCGQHVHFCVDGDRWDSERGVWFGFVESKNTSTPVRFLLAAKTKLDETVEGFARLDDFQPSGGNWGGWRFWDSGIDLKDIPEVYMSLGKWADQVTKFAQQFGVE